MSKSSGSMKGRGAGGNPGNRFQSWERSAVDDGWEQADDEDAPALRTEVRREAARSIIARNDSPDIGFDRSINPYQGCEHGCIYCYARPSHAWLGLSPGLDFETRIVAKDNAAELLRLELAAPGYRCAPIALGSNTDPYQPAERRLRITRAVLEVLAECGHPVTITTKSSGVERDLDLLAPMAEKRLVRVFMSVMHLDPALSRTLEPRATAPARRIESIRRLVAAGVPTGVVVAPVIPLLTDPWMERVLEAAAEAGAREAGYILLRLPREVKELFEDWLARHAPLKAEHVMSLMRQMRGGRDNDPRFGSRMTGSGAFAALIAQRFERACARLGLNGRSIELDVERFRPPSANGQLSLL